MHVAPMAIIIGIELDLEQAEPFLNVHQPGKINNTHLVHSYPALNSASPLLALQ